MNKGLIVSIQGYTQQTTQELAEICSEFVVGIRTDQQIKIDKPVIMLKKLKDKPYYITTTREAIVEIQDYADYIAIDCRKGNQNIDLLLAHCFLNKKKVIADIEGLKDVINILTWCKKLKIDCPEYFATTFSFLKTGNHDFGLIREIKICCDVKVIAEGKIKNKKDCEKAYELGADNVCIGSEISDIKYLTRKFI